MRKRLFSLLLVLALAASLTACESGKSKKEEKKVSTVNREIEADGYTDFIKECANEYKNYITLGQYKDREIDDIDMDLYTVTEESNTDYISKLLETTGTTREVNEGVTKKGDSIKLDYSGKLDGEAFSGGTATNASYVIGSGSFISDLDKGLEGLNVGQTYDIPCRFPDNYGTSTLAGKDVIFTVTVLAIVVKDVPELTDEWVKEYSEKAGLKSSNVEEFKSNVNTYLVNSAQESLASARYASIYKKLQEEMEISDYPEEELEYTKNLIDENIRSEFEYYGSMYGISDFQTYVNKMYGCETTDAYNQFVDENAKDFLFEKMLIFMIAAENDITVTSEDIYEKGDEIAADYGYDNLDAIVDEHGKEMYCEVGYEVICEKVIKFISENNK